VIERRRRRKLF